MFWLRLCLKCEGDLQKGSDIHGSYIACLQCGHYLTYQEERALGIGDQTEKDMLATRRVGEEIEAVEGSQAPSMPLTTVA